MAAPKRPLLALDLHHWEVVYRADGWLCIGAATGGLVARLPPLARDRLDPLAWQTHQLAPGLLGPEQCFGHGGRIVALDAHGVLPIDGQVDLVLRVGDGGSPPS